VHALPGLLPERAILLQLRRGQDARETFLGILANRFHGRAQLLARVRIDPLALVATCAGTRRRTLTRLDTRLRERGAHALRLLAEQRVYLRRLRLGQAQPLREHLDPAFEPPLRVHLLAPRRILPRPLRLCRRRRGEQYARERQAQRERACERTAGALPVCL